MLLTARTDTSPADWIVAGAVPWQRLVEFGPPGFAAYARLRHLPDPAYHGQSENEVDAEGTWWEDRDQLPALVRVLAEHTTRPDDCYFCAWEGYGHSGDIRASPFSRGEMPLWYSDKVAGSAQPSPLARPAPHPAPRPQPPAPQVLVGDRAYFLFHGPLTAAHDWGETELRAGRHRLHAPEPAFIWPADHAWCVAGDVDPHWTGIGADTHVIDQLVSDPRLDVVPADPAAEPPRYR